MTAPDGFLPLAATEWMDSRPFTDPAQNATDWEIVRAIIAVARAVLSQPLEWPAAPAPLVLKRVGDENRLVRLVFCREADLNAHEDLFLVAFFGQRRLDKDRALINAVDEDLIHEFAQHQGVLSYCSFELPDGNYANLVLLRPEAARDHWRTSAKHAYAAQELAPEYYNCVRLHNGVLSGGLWSGAEPRLVRTKYYDFCGPLPWRAVRDLE
jgi:hypothetical protein